MNTHVINSPVLLQSSLHEVLWGGNHLQTIAGKNFDSTAKIGESWETETSNKVLNAPYKGLTLAELTQISGTDFLGTNTLEIFGNRFPLLAKFIDAHSKLSVQVHPNDEYARTNEGGKLGKTETWYILHTEPGAHIIHGLRQQTTKEEITRAIQETKLEEYLHFEPVKAGDIIFVPAGTVHAIGSGIVLYELQEYSDVTYRLYDYGRVDANGKQRDLHISKSLEVMSFQTTELHKFLPQVVDENESYILTRLSACEYFILERLGISTDFSNKTDGSSCIILTCLEGAATVSSFKPREYSLSIKKGETLVIPAKEAEYSIHNIQGDKCTLLRSSVPSKHDLRVQNFWDYQKTHQSFKEEV